MNHANYKRDAENTIGPAIGYNDPRGAAETRQAEIPHQLEKLERTLKGCMQGLDTLGAKLENSVMRPDTANDCAKEPAPVPSTALGSSLQAMTQAAAHLNARIQSMTVRLEV